MRALLLLGVVIVIAFVCVGCVVTPGGGGGGGGGGGYQPSTYSVTITNNHYFAIGWVLTLPGQWTALQSGYLPSYASVTISGLTGGSSYDVDVYSGGLDGPYVGSYRINGGGSYAVGIPSGGKPKNVIQTIDVDSDTIDIEIRDLVAPTKP